MAYQIFFQQAISELKKENRYRKFLNISRLNGQFPYAINNETGEKIVLWCSNDYLGMGQDTQAIAAAIDAINRCGLGSGGTRNISGNNNFVVDLEKKVAELNCKESALCFVSGYVANDTTIQALAKIIPNLVIFSDAKNHASIISGIRNSKLEKHIFKHNDMVHLEELLAKFSHEKPKLIICESVYSMDGDFGKLTEIAALAKKYNALTFVDEVHAVGLYGANGAGLCEALNLTNEIDIIQGTFAKALGCIGGYISGNKDLVDAVRLCSSGFIFTTSLPPMICAAIAKNIDTLKQAKHTRQKHQENVAKLKNLLIANNINIVENQSHIVSIRIGDAKKAEEISQKLLKDFGIYIQHINYPTVAKGDERLRITVTPLHTDQMITDLVDALRQI